jgi:DNA-binding NarL/FixJ family response regulator
MIVAAATSDASETFLATLDSRPDAVVLSATLPGGAIETIERIREQLPETEFIVMADSADEALMLRVVASGAHGLLLGETDPARVPHAIRGILDGESAFPRRMVRLMADELARRDRRRRVPGADGATLTIRETEVLQALAAGRSTADVAALLRISAATVRRHAATATGKLGAGGRAEALEMMRSAGLAARSADR